MERVLIVEAPCVIYVTDTSISLSTTLKRKLARTEVPSQLSFIILDWRMESIGALDICELLLVLQRVLLLSI